MNNHRAADRRWSEAGACQLRVKLFFLLPHNVRPTRIFWLQIQDCAGELHRIVRDRRWLKGHPYMANSGLKSR